jgi:TolB-like protein/DNA-binding winged helix-turn-helix (wHTH) protein/Tfp pilus assembly protein PilF
MATESSQRSRIVRFGTFEADLANRELRKSGVRIKLHGQPFELLVMLLERPGVAVPREELRQRLWSTDTFVDFDAGVNTAINRLREALSDSAENPRFIETVPRRGYRFIASVEAEGSEQPVVNVIPTKHPFSRAVQTVAPVPANIHGRRGKVLAVGFAVVVALLIGLSLTSVRERLLGRSNRPQSHVNSLAVLPLVNLSGDPEQDFFADGMTEALITDLGKISALRVISRTSVVQYKGTKKPLPEIARELNVDAFIEGTISRSGSHLRITANLLQASPEKHLWAESYESEVGDILVLQGQVAQAVAREIRVKLTPEEQKLLGNPRSVDPKAHDDYLKGRYLCNRDTRGPTDKGIQYFQQAIEEDRNDPLAYAGLADCYVHLAWGGDIFAGDLSPQEIMPKARDAAQKALQLDESLADAHTTLADVEMILDWNWSSAEREFKRAIELNPNYSAAHSWYAHYLVAMGRFDESMAEAKRSLELDPFSEVTTDFAEWAFQLARRYDMTVQQAKKSLDLAPEFPWAHWELGWAYERTGRASEAVQELMKAEELFGMSQERLAELRKAYHESGEKGYWRKMLEFYREASKEPRTFGIASGYGSVDYFQHVEVAAVQVRLGEFNAAFESLAVAGEKHDTNIIYLKVDPYWDAIHSDPRFQTLLRRMGLEG